VVLFPLSQNISYVEIGSIRTLFVSILIAQLLLVIGKIILKQPVKGSLLVSGLYMLFFSYGHVEAILQGYISVGSFLRGTLIILWLVLFGLWVFWVLLKMKHTRTVSNYFNIVAIILVVFPIYDLITYSRLTPETERLAREYQQYVYDQNGFQRLFDGQVNVTGESPDIYYIILDGYTRADVLEEFYGYDNSEFISELEKRGFYVAPNSHSNYSDTVYSLASSLNMAHVNTIADFLDEKGIYGDEEFMKDILSILIKDNVLMKFLRKQGYQVVAFDSGYDRTNIETADYFLRSPDISDRRAQEAFEMMIWDTSIGKTLFEYLGMQRVPLQGIFDDHRKRIRFSFEEISDIKNNSENKIVFAHILSPHAPYVFGPNGEDRVMVDPYTLLEGDTIGDWTPQYYSDQVNYINILILEMIDEVISHSSKKPVIILQADHSSRAHKFENPTMEMRMKLHYPILSAYYTPDIEPASLFYPSISPINIFRVLLNHYFGVDIEHESDTSYYYNKWIGKGKFIDVCLEYSYCEP